MSSPTPNQVQCQWNANITESSLQGLLLQGMEKCP